MSDNLVSLTLCWLLLSPSRSFNSTFSADSFPVLRRSALFSACNLLFSVSICVNNSSNSSIRAFLRSRAVCAATRFFNFLLIILSSGLRFVSLFLFFGSPLMPSPSVTDIGRLAAKDVSGLDIMAGFVGKEVITMVLGVTIVILTLLSLV